jgi:coatomer subunit beta
VTLSSASSAIEAAAKCYIDLIMKESDNSVKLIVLDRLADIKRNPNYLRILQNMVMDILQVLAAPDLEVKKKTLELVLDLVSARNIGEVVMFLKKEMAKVSSLAPPLPCGECRPVRCMSSSFAASRTYRPPSYPRPHALFFRQTTPSSRRAPSTAKS